MGGGEAGAFVVPDDSIVQGNGCAAIAWALYRVERVGVKNAARRAEAGGLTPGAIGGQAALACGGGDPHHALAVGRRTQQGVLFIADGDDDQGAFLAGGVNSALQGRRASSNSAKANIDDLCRIRVCDAGYSNASRPADGVPKIAFHK